MLGAAQNGLSFRHARVKTRPACGLAYAGESGWVNDTSDAKNCRPARTQSLLHKRSTIMHKKHTHTPDVLVEVLLGGAEAAELRLQVAHALLAHGQPLRTHPAQAL